MAGILCCPDQQPQPFLIAICYCDFCYMFSHRKLLSFSHVPRNGGLDTLLLSIGVGVCNICQYSLDKCKLRKLILFFMKCITNYNYLCVLSHSHVLPSEIPWTVARQAPLSMEFSRPEYWSRLPFPISGDLSDLGIKFVHQQEDSL